MVTWTRLMKAVKSPPPPLPLRQPYADLKMNANARLALHAVDAVFRLCVHGEMGPRYNLPTIKNVAREEVGERCQPKSVISGGGPTSSNMRRFSANRPS